jgi:stage IV sporulation protein FB
MGYSTLAPLGRRLALARFRVGHACGVPISIHWSWLPCMLLWVVWGTSGYSSKSWEFAEIVAMFLIVLLHEMGHVAVARGVGRAAREVVLWPLGGVALTEMPNWCADEVLVAAAGRAVNLVLLPVLFGMWYWFGYFRGGNVSQLLWRVAWDNVGILFFNLLPIWPLDGGRVV